VCRAAVALTMGAACAGLLMQVRQNSEEPGFAL